MSVFAGPEINEDGSVLALDAGNIKSYSGSGETLVDLTGNGRNGTLTNGALYENINGGCITFDGGNDYIDTGYLLVNGTDAAPPIYIEFVINADETQPATTNGPLWIGSAYYSGFGMRYSGSVFQIWLRTSAGTFTDTLPLQRGIFQHVILGYGGEVDPSLYSYINGGLNSGRGITYAAFNQNLNSYPFRIGRPYTTGGNTATGYFSGKIAMVRVYNRSLSASEIRQNFNALRGRYGI